MDVHVFTFLTMFSQCLMNLIYISRGVYVQCKYVYHVL
jgi:hypothetical protein